MAILDEERLHIAVEAKAHGIQLRDPLALHCEGLAVSEAVGVAGGGAPQLHHPGAKTQAEQRLVLRDELRGHLPQRLVARRASQRVLLRTLAEAGPDGQVGRPFAIEEAGHLKR